MLINNYDIDVFNGEEGRIVDFGIDINKQQYIVVNFPYVTFIKDDEPYEIKENQFYTLDLVNSEDAGDGKLKVTFDKLVKIYLSKKKVVNTHALDMTWVLHPRVERRSSRALTEETVPTTDDIDLSYVLTVHKSQGSEWKIGIVYMPESASMEGSFINRNLTYAVRLASVKPSILLAM